MIVNPPPPTPIVNPPPPPTPIVNPPPPPTPIVNPPPPTPIVNPPPPTPTPIVTPPANTHIDYATSDGSSLRLTYDSALPYPWTLHDPSGVVSSFDPDGNLVVMQHPAGPKMTFTWANKHLTQIVDTTGRTIYLNYDAKDKFLTCLSRDTTCTKPLVTYKVDGWDDLAAVSYGTSTEGSVQYVYHRGERSSWYVGYEAADASCTSLCAARTTSPSQCRNEDVCHFNVCQTIGGADTVAGTKACMNYCRPSCLAQCARTPAGTAICPECGPAHLAPTCSNQCALSCGSFCADLKGAAASCVLSLPSYCAATDCKSDCLKKLSSPLPEAPSQAYFVGHRDELNHNIEQIIDDQGRIALVNRYGTDPNDESFDKIIDQQVGDIDEAESHGQFEYHDLKLEDQQLQTWSFSNQPSVPSPSVIPLRSFVAKTICPQTCAPGAGINGCVSPTYAYGAAFDYSAVPVGGTSPVMQVPRYWTGVMETLSSATFAPGGWPRSKTSEGITTTFVTDGFGRVIEERDSAGGLRRHGYDRQGRVAWDAVMQPSALSTPYARPQPDIAQVAQMTEYGYDHLGRALTVTRWHVEDQTALVKTTSYLDPQRTVVETEAGLTTTTVFDGAGRVARKTLPNGSTVSFGYAGDSGSIVTKTTQTNNPSKPTTVETTTLDGMGFTASVVDDQNTPEHSEGHDIEGHLRWTVDLAGNAPTAFEYDGFGRLKTERRIFEAVPPQQATRTTTAIYGYDNNDRRTSVTDGRNNTTTFQLDSADRLSVRTDPLGRQTTFQYYTGTRRVWVQTDPSGTAFTRTYDPLGRASTETTAPGAGLDVGARQTTYGYDTVGRLNEVDYGGAGLQGWDNNVTMQFDSLGRKVHEANSLFGFGIDHTYDLGARWKTTSIAGATEQQSFDTLGRLSGVSLNGTALALYNYGTAGVGGPLSIAYSTGAQTAFTYDARNRQTDFAVQENGATLLSLHTALGADGIPRERVQSFTGRSVTNAFQVDRFGRVTAESLDVAGATPLTGDVTNDQVAPWMQAGDRWRSYGLDATANWKSWNDSQTGADAPSLDARNAYTTFTGRQPVYDTADNAVSIPDATGDEAYTYDVYKHPLTATKNDRAVSYVYDGLGRRIAEQDASGTTYLLWDGSQFAARGPSRTDASNWTLEVGGADIDEHIASVDALGRGTVRIYHQTIDGSVLGVSDGTGLLEAYSYSAYGEVTFRNPDGTARPDSALGTRFLYHGQLFSPWTRTYSMRAREYRPTWGRFLSTDPIGLDGGLNLYAFVDGSPLHLRDPMGTDAHHMSNLGLDWTLGTPELSLGNPGTVSDTGISLDGTELAWNTWGHNHILNEAFDGPSGPSLAKEDVDTLKAASAAVDKDQSTDGSYQHAMRSPNETVDDAQVKAEGFVLGKMMAAVLLEKNGNHNNAMFQLGEGMHTLMDSTSPAHAGYQEWKGMDHVVAFAQHIGFELWPSAKAAQETAQMLVGYYTTFQALSLMLPL